MLHTAVNNNPVDVGGVEGGGVAILVELYGTASAFEADQLTPFEAGQVEFHAHLAPGGTVEEVVGGGDGDDGVVQVVDMLVFHIACREGGEQQGIVELAFGEGGLHAEKALVAHLKASGGVGVG
jgi:hypothetical protein